MERSFDPGPPVGSDGADTGIAGDYEPEVLAALDAWEWPESAAPTLPTRLVSWRRTSLVGAVMTGMAFGLREVLEPERRQQIVIEVDADGEPEHLPIELRLDPNDPSSSWCIVRRDPPAQHG